MKKQIIVTIGREYGSAGHFIAGHLAQKLVFTLYDKRFFIECHDQIGYSAEIMEKYDENHVVIRFATSWATREEDVEMLIQHLSAMGEKQS
jgi:hypothetical protein